MGSSVARIRTMTDTLATFTSSAAIGETDRCIENATDERRLKFEVCRGQQKTMAHELLAAVPIHVNIALGSVQLRDCFIWNDHGTQPSFSNPLWFQTIVG
jgi:hypothetical protein